MSKKETKFAVAKRELISRGWFTEPGAYVLVDGQFGSTGKGLLAHFLAEVGAGQITAVTTNAGPNSGHTTYVDGEKLVTKQIPVAGVVLQKRGCPVDVHLNAGAVIDYETLKEEVEWLANPEYFTIHPCAAVIEEEDTADVESLAAIASTGKGVGQAMARKILREGNVAIKSQSTLKARMHDKLDLIRLAWRNRVIFVETAQGFSLGVNQPMYPFTTSRECTVGQALSDAGFPPRSLQKSVMSLRTYPIRVGNTSAGWSGPGYRDQTELSWEEIGQKPERTTVTNRVRRVFSWSRDQFRDACRANDPDLLFLNFCNYLSEEQLGRLLEMVAVDYQLATGRNLDGLLLGFGPTVEDIEWRAL